jgi:parallel beta-helix repeat protein
VLLQGGATVRGLTVDTATATDDRIAVSVTAGGAARFDGTITSTDLTATRTYTLPNASGTFAVSASGNIALSAAGDISLTGQVPIANGGTNANTSQGAINNLSQLTTNGDLLYHNGTNSTRLARGTNGQCLTSNATTLIWGSCGLAAEADTLATVTGRGATTSTAVLLQGGATVRGLTVDTATGTDDKIALSVTTGGAASFTGTITSADLTAARTYTLPNASGTLAVSASGNIALSAAGDISLTGQVPIANGGTNASTAQGAINNISGLTTNGDLLYNNGTNSTRLARGANGECLTSNATTILWGSCVSAEADTLATVTGRGASTSTAVLLQGGATVRGMTVDTATATDDLLTLSVTTGGAARFTGAITSTDLTAARTWTLPDSTGTFITTGNLSSITATGALASGSIAAGFGTISTNNNITTSTTLQGATVNATSVIQLGGADINTAGTLTNVAYENQANVFTLGNTFQSTLTVNTSTATQDQIAVTAAAVGAARFTGTVTNADLTAARTWTLPDASGTFAVSASGNIALSATGDITLTGQVPIANGGTNANTSQGAINNLSQLTTNGDLLYHNGTNSTRLARGTNGQCLTSNATTIIWGACVSAEADTLATVTGRGATTSTAVLLQGGATVRGLTVDTATATDDRIAVSVTAGGAARFDGTITSTDLTAARTYTLPNASGTFAVSASGNIALSATGDISLTGQVPIANGGTNASTSQGAINNLSQLTTNGDLLYNNGTNSTRLARGTNGQCLTSNATTLIWGSCGLTSEADTLATVTGRGATTSTAVLLQGSATIRGMTIDTATATDDLIAMSVTTGGAARFTGTITSADLTAARTWTLPDASGTFCLQSSASCGFATGTAASYIQNQNASQQATSNFWISGNGRADTALQAPTFDTATAGTLTLGGTATAISVVDNVTLAASLSLTVTGGNTASRPGSPTEGMIYFDTTTKQLLTYSNGKWQSDSKTASMIVAANDSSQSDKDGAQYVGTGTNDEAKINSAITALPASGGIVYLAPGTYNLGATITANKANVTLAGAGNATVIKRMWNETVDNTSGMVTLSVNKFTFRNLQFDGNKATYTNTFNHGILSSSSRDKTVIKDSTFTNISGDAIKVRFNILGSAGDSSWTIQDNTITSTTGNAIYTDRVGGTVSGNVITSSGGNGIDMSGCTGSGPNPAVHIEGNSVTGSGTYGIAVACTAEVQGNYASGNGVGAHLIGSLSTLTNNVLIGNTNNGADVWGGSSTVTGNRFDSNSRGLDLRGNYSIISGNSFTSNTQTGIGFTAGGNTGNTITENSFVDNNTTGGASITMGNSVSTIITNNTISDSTGAAGCAIEVASVAGAQFSNNRFSGVGASQGICNTASDTVFTDQLDANGNTINRTQGGAYTFGTTTAAATLTLQGSLKASQLAAPTLSATVTNVGTAGSTTYRYQITAYDGVGETTGSTIQQTTTGNATLSGTNYNTITWTALPGAYQYKIYRCSGAACTPALLATVAGNLTSYNDQAAGSPSGAVPTTNTTGGASFAGILQGASSLTLGTSGSTTGTLVVKNSTNANTITITSAAASANRTVTLGDESGTVCLQNSANCGFAAGTAASYIQNQNASQQATSNFWISGNGRADTALQAPTFDTATAGALTIGGTATSISVVDNVTLGAGLSLRVTGGNTASRPGSPTEGMVYFDTDTKQLLTYSNGKWQADTKGATVVVAAGGSSQTAKDGAQYVGDGTNDQNAINSAISSGLPAAGGTVVLMEGTYNLTAPITMNKAKVILAGQGNNSVLKRMYNEAGASSGLILISTTSNTVRNVYLDGNKGSFSNANNNSIYNQIFMDGTIIRETRVANSAGIGIYFDGVVGGPRVIANLVEGGNSSGIFVRQGQRGVVEGNIAATNAGAGISIGDGNGVTVTGNTAESNDVGILAGNTADTVSGNTLRNNTSVNINITGANSTVSDNAIYAGAVGVQFGSGVTGIVLSNNNISNTTSHGIYILGGAVSNTVISGNYIGSVGGAGISGGVATNSNITISSNTIYNYGGTGSASGITLSSSEQNFRIIGNSITDTAGTGYAINIGSGATGMYLSGNNFSGTGAASINDAGTATTFASQINPSGALVQQASGGFLVQNSSGNNVFGVDTSAGQALLGTSSSVNGKLVVRNATNSNTVTIQTGVTSASYTLTLPTALGSSGQCLSDTTGTGVLGWANCSGGGGGSSAKKITFTPEYAGGVLKADGTNNNGTMTTDFVNGLTSGEGYKHNFYEWTSSQATAQDYDIYVTHQLPSDFNATTEFDASTWKVWTYVDNNTNSTILMTVYDADGTACANGVSIEGAGTGWTQVTLTDFDTNANCDFAANDIITIKVSMSSLTPNTNKVRVGEIQYGYTN